MSVFESPRKLIAEGATGVSMGVRGFGAAWKSAKTFIDKQPERRNNKRTAKRSKRIRRKYTQKHAPIHVARGVISVGVLFSFTFAMLPLYHIATSLRKTSHTPLALFYLRTLNRILNVRVHVVGKPEGKGPFFLASNHASWLDIPVLGSILPMDFMALGSLQQYHGFGFMARQGRSQFISGTQGRSLLSERGTFEAKLREGTSMAFFPESMIGTGNSLYAFRSSFMGMQDEHGAPIAVIPVSISYSYVSGMPMSRKTRACFGWRGNCSVAETIWNAACLGAMDVVVSFHSPMKDETGAERTEIARYCQHSCARGLAWGLHRWTPPWQQSQNNKVVDAGR